MPCNGGCFLMRPVDCTKELVSMPALLEEGRPTADAVFRRLCCTDDDEPELRETPHQATLITWTRVLPAPGTLTAIAVGVRKKHHQQEARVCGQHQEMEAGRSLRSRPAWVTVCIAIEWRDGSVDKPAAH